uniref:Uncharacterized protein n=1 Tax=Compsopogon caeruleus TaxID=31354 RepID=A0A7S1T526_9RHOD|mmetsp:Transcript_10194/g.20571  ORF Transcript_10194/g.20571 Transcript_10194/m.20571 type:complete len:150 (+) Transcript_10194:135-584(+)
MEYLCQTRYTKTYFMNTAFLENKRSAYRTSGKRYEGTRANMDCILIRHNKNLGAAVEWVLPPTLESDSLTLHDEWKCPTETYLHEQIPGDETGFRGAWTGTRVVAHHLICDGAREIHEKKKTILPNHNDAPGNAISGRQLLKEKSPRPT